jgi:hypothetical protein
MDHYDVDIRGHLYSSTMELASTGSSSFDCFAHGFIMAKTFTTSSMNLPIREVSETAVQKAQAQDRDSPLADTPVWKMARTSPPKPMKPGIYLLECPREGANVLTLLGPASHIALGP